MALQERRLKKDLEMMERIGADSDGGITRLAYSEKDNASHEYLKNAMEKEGFRTRYDAAMNLYISLGEGTKRLVIGSHLDSVRNGGNYDGVVGVLAGAEILRNIKEDSLPMHHSIELVVFRGEESSRFGKAMIGSGAATGTLDEKTLSLIDQDSGMTVREAIRLAGGKPDELGKAVWKKEDNACYGELHIEQGRTLEDSGDRIGIVTGIAAPVRYWFDIYGRKDHSGNTPMALRADASDALFMAGMEKKSVMDKCMDMGYPTVATIGDIRIPGGSMNTVPGHARYCLDLRDIDEKRRDGIEQELMARFRIAAQAHGCRIEWQETERKSPLMLPESLYRMTEGSCRANGLPYRLMPSGAGHDGLPLGHFGIPVWMMFIPSRDGISHAKEEFSSFDDIMAGTRVAFDTLKGLDRMLIAR